MFAQLHVYAFARLRICTCTHLHVYAFARVRICICTHLHVYAITHLCICTFAHLHVCKFARLRICTYTHLHVYAFALLHVCAFACLRICRCAHLHVCAFARVRICTFTHLHFYAFARFCICRCAYLHVYAQALQAPLHTEQLSSLSFFIHRKSVSHTISHMQMIFKQKAIIVFGYVQACKPFFLHPPPRDYQSDTLQYFTQQNEIQPCRMCTAKSTPSSVPLLLELG